jgi:hypothetical protein
MRELTGQSWLEVKIGCRRSGDAYDYRWGDKVMRILPKDLQALLSAEQRGAV